MTTSPDHGNADRTDADHADADRSDADRSDTERAGWGVETLLLPLRAYRWVSPLLPQRCRFYPSCSAYAMTALRQHGAARGSWLVLRRLVRCQPFCAGGYDPVPTPDRLLF